MYRGSRFGVRFTFVLAVLVAGWNHSQPCASAQDLSAPHDLIARGRVFPEISGGVSAIKKDPAGRYYILAAPAKSIAIYQAEGKRIGRIPNEKSPADAIVYAQDFDIDSTGRIVVADRGANAVKIFAPDGSLETSFAVSLPLSVIALPDGTCALKSLSSAGVYLRILNRQGKVLRTLRTPPQSPSEGPIFGDSAAHIYLSFTDTDDPTVRKYDLYGASEYEFSLRAADFAPPASRKQWTKITIERGATPASTKLAIQAFAADPESQETWVAISDQLVHFDKDGNRRAAYTLSTSAGAPIQPTALLVEHARILIAGEELGIFDFPLPERLATSDVRP
jgi:hypothetical protein